MPSKSIAAIWAGPRSDRAVIDPVADGPIGDGGLAARWQARRIGRQDAWELTLVLRNEGDTPIDGHPC